VYGFVERGGVGFGLCVEYVPEGGKEVFPSGQRLRVVVAWVDEYISERVPRR
jgi:hypothetical protein